MQEAIRRLKLKAKKLPKPSKPLHPKLIGVTYFKELKPIVQVLKNILNSTIKPQLKSILGQADANRPKNDSLRLDAYSDDINKLMAKSKIQFEKTVPAHNATRISTKIAHSINQFNKKDTSRVFKSVLGVDPFLTEPWLNQEMSAFVHSNVALIKTIPQKFFDRIETQVFQAAKAGTRQEALEDKLDKIPPMSENQAALIARDQTSKFNGNLSMLRQQEVGVEKFLWQTSEDERVRDLHDERDQQIYPWDYEFDDTEDDGPPGQPINCRCVAIPVFDEDVYQTGEGVEASEDEEE